MGDPAGEFADRDGCAPEGLAPEGLAPAELAPEGVALEGVAPEGLADELRLVPATAAGGALADAVVCGTDCWLAAAVVDSRPRFAGVVEGPKVATDSMAPATRHTARMLASNGMTVPVPPNGAVSFRSRSRRRWTRCSRR